MNGQHDTVNPRRVSKVVHQLTGISHIIGRERDLLEWDPIESFSPPGCSLPQNYGVHFSHYSASHELEEAFEQPALSRRKV